VAQASASIGAALLLVWVRAAFAMLIVPILGGRPLPKVVALILSAALSLAVAPAAFPFSEPSTAELVLLLAREATIGALFGLSARIAFSIFESLGGLVGAAAGTGGASMEGDEPSGAFAALYAAVGAGVFLTAGGHHALVSALASSFRSSPVAPSLGGLEMGAAAEGAVALFSSAFSFAVMLAAPAFAAALAIDAVAGIASRLAPLSGFDVNAPLIRSTGIQIAAVAIMTFAVRIGVEFLERGLTRAAGAS